MTTDDHEKRLRALLARAGEGGRISVYERKGGYRTAFCHGGLLCPVEFMKTLPRRSRLDWRIILRTRDTRKAAELLSEFDSTRPLRSLEEMVRCSR